MKTMMQIPVFPWTSAVALALLLGGCASQAPPVKSSSAALQDNRIDFRSRSSIGLYDFGKNRSRMAAFATRFEQATKR